ncbi:MAG TPA: hypothetical protein VJM57_00575 [Thermodesulfobacteriota bacterium]|nr:hypothetical protein [Thermodesulfobacteriota bacterium]
MSERKTVEKVVGRMYRHHLKATGRLPEAKTKRAMEEMVKKAAEVVENRKRRR